MLKEKWKKLLLQEKILILSGILFLFSIPLSLIIRYCIAVAITFFLVFIFYNMYKLIQMSNALVSEHTKIDSQTDELKNVFESIALILAFGIGLLTILLVLIYLWIIVLI